LAHEDDSPVRLRLRHRTDRERSLNARE